MTFLGTQLQEEERKLELDLSSKTDAKTELECDLPNVDACTSQTLALDYHGLDAILASSSAGSRDATTATTNDKEVGFSGNGSHVESCDGEMSR